MPGRDEDVKVCLQALSEMRWAFSKGNERSQAIRLAWRSHSDHPSQPLRSSPDMRSGGDRNTMGGTPRQRQPGRGGPPQQKRPRDTPPTHGFSGSVQQQQLHVSSLPSHSAPHVPSSSDPSHSVPLRDQAPPSQHRTIPPDSAVTILPAVSHPEPGAPTPTTFVDRGVRPNWSPVHHQLPGGATSIHSSSSDGSSPPEIAAQPMPVYNVSTKSPGVYEATSMGYPHPTIETSSYAYTPLRTNPHHAYPPTAPPPRNMGGVVQNPAWDPQQYTAPFHAGPGPYPLNMVSNTTDATNYMYPIGQQHHPMGYISNPGTSPGETGGYSNGAEYFPLSTDIHYHPGVLSRPAGHNPHPYPSYADSIYYAPQ